MTDDKARERLARYWAKVEVKNADDCWEWTAGRSPRGYGLFRYPQGSKAHRFSWQLANGRPLRQGEVVRHRCDNPPCVNPAHLDVGTQLDNVRDRDERGRHARLCGSRHGIAKLTEEQVAHIRTVYRCGHPEFGGRALARRYGVSQPTIRRVVHGVLWTHVPSSAALRALRGES